MGKQVSGGLSKTLTWAATWIMSLAVIALAITTAGAQEVARGREVRPRQPQAQSVTGC